MALISSLGYVAVETAKLEAWRKFATQVVGFMEVPDLSGDDTLYFRMDERPFRLRIFKGEKERFVHAGWEASSKAAFDTLVGRLKEAGVAVETASAEEAEARATAGLVRAEDPCGNAFELYYGRVYDYQPFISPVGVKGFITGDMGMGHVVLPAEDIEKVHDFYTQVLDFGDTDEMSLGEFGKLYFMHAGNPRHHSLALYSLPHPSGLIHMMFEVPDIDEVGRAFDRREDHNVAVASTLGRHSNDRLFSFYMYSPSGFAVEIGADGVQIQDWDRYLPTISRLPSLWGHKWRPPT